METIKFKANIIWKVGGIACIFVALISFVLVISLISEGVKMFSILNVELYIGIILSIVLGVYYINLNKIDYIRCTEGHISIHRGIVYKRKNIKLEEIAEVRKFGNKLVLILHNSNEVKVKLVFMKSKDMDVLIKHLASNIPVT